MKLAAAITYDKYVKNDNLCNSDSFLISQRKFNYLIDELKKTSLTAEQEELVISLFLESLTMVAECRETSFIYGFGFGSGDISELRFNDKKKKHKK